MKNVAAFFLAALVFTGGGIIALSAARFERHMADAQEQASTQQFSQARESLDAAEGYLQFAQWIPKIGDDSLKEVRARKAALQYWQGDFASVLPAQAEPVAAVDESNVELQLVVANAAFRNGLKGKTDKTQIVQALSEAANGYATVLKNNVWEEEAAHNYEYVVRLRDEIQKGKKPPSEQAQMGFDLGEAGAPSPSTSMKGFQIYVPLEGNERSPSGGDAGKAGAKERKG